MTAPVPAGRLGALDRLAAVSLTWVLVLTWGGGVGVVVLWAAGMSAEHTSVPWWAVGVAVVVASTTGVPVHRWLRPAVDAALFSHPEDAAALIADLGRQVARSGAPASPEEVGAEIAALVQRRLRLPYVAVEAAGGVARGAPGKSAAVGPDGREPWAGRLVRIPLRFAGEDVGTLLAGPRGRQRSLGTADLELLGDIAAGLAMTLHAVRTSADLRASRAAVITAREEERRRIRRDLHDGLAPTLAAVRLHLAAVEQLVPDRPDEALVVLDRLRGQVRDSSAQLRGLVYALQPPLLDDLGLVEAIGARAADLAATGTAVDVAVADDLPTLPAAVDVALYRIAAEALANAGRHAGATRVTLRLSATTDAVGLVLDDDGHGLPSPLVAGVGLTGMRERAEELGGTLTMAAGEGGRGTRVGVVLPLTPGGVP